VHVVVVLMKKTEPAIDNCRAWLLKGAGSERLIDNH